MLFRSRPLTAEEMQEAAAEAQANLEELGQRVMEMKGLGGSTD